MATRMGAVLVILMFVSEMQGCSPARAESPNGTSRESSASGAPSQAGTSDEEEDAEARRRRMTEEVRRGTIGLPMDVPKCPSSTNCPAYGDKVHVVTGGTLERPSGEFRLSLRQKISFSEPSSVESYLDALEPHAGRLAECLEVASYERDEREAHLEFTIRGGEHAREKSKGELRLHSVSMGGDVLEDCVAAVLSQIDSPLSDPEPDQFSAVASICYHPDTDNKLEPAPEVVVRAESSADRLSEQSDVYVSIQSCFLRRPRPASTPKGSGAATLHVNYQRGKTRKVTVMSDALPSWLESCVERQLACSVQPPNRAEGDATWNLAWEY